ncbi:site-2 protease family protein [Paraglaciecola sp.]|uniref:site-2 protease family protein n=1 Tax=Paraglaciecola sp. TaxID=1920173 RepID=UPI0030F4B20A
MKKLILICFIALPLTLLFSIISHEFGHVLGARLFGVNNMAIYVWPGYEVYPKFAKRVAENWPNEVIAYSRIVPAPESSAIEPSPILYAPPKEVFLHAKKALKQTTELLYSQQSGSVSQFQLNGLAQLENGTISENSSTNDDIKWPTIQLKTERHSTNMEPFQTGIIAFMGSGINSLLAMLALLFLYLAKPKGVLFFVLSCSAFLYYDMLTYVIFPRWFDMRHLIFWGGKESEPVIALLQLGVDATAATFAIVTLSVFQSILLFRVLSRHNESSSAG